MNDLEKGAALKGIMAGLDMSIRHSQMRHKRKRQAEMDGRNEKFRQWQMDRQAGLDDMTREAHGAKMEEIRIAEEQREAIKNIINGTPSPDNGDSLFGGGVAMSSGQNPFGITSEHGLLSGGTVGLSGQPQVNYDLSIPRKTPESITKGFLGGESNRLEDMMTRIAGVTGNPDHLKDAYAMRSGKKDRKRLTRTIHMGHNRYQDQESYDNGNTWTNIGEPVDKNPKAPKPELVKVENRDGSVRFRTDASIREDLKAGKEVYEKPISIDADRHKEITRSLIERFLKDKDAIDYIAGFSSTGPALLPSSVDAETLFDQIKNRVTLEQLPKLKGSSSDKELEYVQRGSSGLRQGGTLKALEQALADIYIGTGGDYNDISGLMRTRPSVATTNNDPLGLR